VGDRQPLRAGAALENGMTARTPAAKAESSSRLVTDIFLLAGFCGFLFFFGLSSFGLLGADEPRYAQVAREMLSRHDWITPTLGGKPWLEKPVLYYWQAIIAYRIFGVSDWVARLPSAADATLMVIAVYLFLRRFRPAFHLDGALITASAAGVIGFARAASTDMPLASMLTIAMLAWYAWYESRTKSYLALAFLFLGLGFLAKGPVALLLALLIVVLFAALTHDLAILKETFWIPGIAIFLAIALPWYIAVQLENPQFFRIFILQHNFARFGTNLYHHPEPFWYYLPVVLLALIPWTVFVVVAVSKSVRVWWTKKNERKELRSREDLGIFLTIWLIVPVLFFSISQSKLPGYIVPALPAGSLLVAEYIRRHSARNEPVHILQIVIHSIVACAPLVPALMIQYLLLQHRIPWSNARMPVAFAVVCAVIMAFTLRMSGLRMLRFVTLVPVVLIVGSVLRVGATAVDATLSARPLATEIGRLRLNSGTESETMQVAVFEAPRETEFGLAFYLNRSIARYESHQVPDGEHLVIAPAGSQSVVARAVAGRRLLYLGTFASQGLDYFWISRQSNQHSAISTEP
jgi:4-amino-4-deoxy-L-arabinose transferase-like glycosyltransferase